MRLYAGAVEASAARPAEPTPPVAKKTAVLPPIEERKRDGFAALRQAHRNRTAAASP
jgi:hypothetical protein